MKIIEMQDSLGAIVQMFRDEGAIGIETKFDLIVFRFDDGANQRMISAMNELWDAMMESNASVLQ